jgi:hypothetical protein
VLFLSYTPVVTPTQQTQTPPGTLKFGNFEFHLTLNWNDVPQHGVSFAKPITLTIRYDPASLAGLDPATLQLQSWDGAGWSLDGIAVVSHDIANGTLTVAISHLTEFALFAAPRPTDLEPGPELDGGMKHLYLPAISMQ